MLKSRLTIPLTSLALLSATALSGCNDEQPAPDTNKASAPKHDAHDDHAHPTEGPHHWGLIELGNEEYHGELVHDEKAGTVTIYILDGAAKAAVPIEATELMLNVTREDKGTQYALAARPEEGDADGKSSRFVSDDPKLGEALDAEGTTARLTVKIAGKSYTGQVEHDHDHAGHDH